MEISLPPDKVTRKAAIGSIVFSLHKSVDLISENHCSDGLPAGTVQINDGC